MKITVNGKEETIEGATLSVKGLLSALNVSQPDMVSVQLNGAFVNKENYETTTVKEADTVDFLYFMGGGAHIFSL